MSSIALSIAGISIRTQSAMDSPTLTIPDPISRFSANGQPVDSEILVSMKDLSVLRNRSSSVPTRNRDHFQSSGLWSIDRENGSLFFEFSAPALAPHPYKVASFSPDFKSGSVQLDQEVYSNSSKVYPLEYPLDELLLIYLLGQGRGLLMHASGVVDASGHGYLFAGHSGAGKTTISRLWEQQRGVTILSDDRIVLREEDGILYMYGTPWHGEADLTSTQRVPLNSIFFLKQAPQNSLSLKGSIAAVASLIAYSFPPFHDPEGMNFIMELCDRIVHRIPVYEMQFLPLPSAIELVRNERNETLNH